MVQQIKKLNAYRQPLWIYILSPKRGIFIAITALIFTIFGVVNLETKVNAATGINPTINFQGKVVNSNGTNVTDGQYTFVFRIYDVESGGTHLWTETQSNVQVTAGVFRVSLGSVQSLSGIDFNSDTLYLGVNFNSDGEMSPRVRFASVPYAFNAQTVAGLTVTDTTGTLTVPDSKTVQFGGAFTTSAHDLSLTMSGNTTLTLPTTGTLATLGGVETLSNKSFSSTVTFDGIATDITTDTNENLTISPNGTGNVLIQTGAGGQAALVVDKTGAGDIFAASSSGIPKFVIKDDGNASSSAGFTVNGVGSLQSTDNQTLTIGSGTTGDLVIGRVSQATYLPGFENCTLKTTTGGLLDCGTDNAGSSGDNFWQYNPTLGIVANGNLTTDLLIGGTSTASARFAVLNIAGGTPTASVSAGTAGGMYLTANGNLATTARQHLTVGSGTTGEVSIIGGSGGAIGGSNVDGFGVLIAGGTGGDGGSAGGQLTLRGGTAGSQFGSQSVGGAVVISAGTSSVGADGGSVSINATNGGFGSGGHAPGVGGSITLTTGTGAGAISGQAGAAGGDFTVITGDGGSGNGGGASGGAISLTAGAGALALPGGAINLTSGQGGATGAGGEISLTTGAGGSTSGASGALTLGTGTFTSGGFGTISLKQGSNTRLFVGSNGIIGIGTTSPVSTFQVAGGYGANAAFILDQANNGDIFTASSSGVTRFRIANEGNIIVDTASEFSGNLFDFRRDGTVYLTGNVNGSDPNAFDIDQNQGALNLSAGYDLNLVTRNGGSILLDAAGAIVFNGFDCTGNSNGGVLTANGDGEISCSDDDAGSGGGDNFWQYNSITGIVANGNLTTDLLLGGTSTQSAKFAVLGIAGTDTPVASVSATSGSNANKGIYLSGDGSLQSVRNNTLTIGGSTTGDIQFKPGNVSAPALYLASNGDIGLGTTAPRAALDLTKTFNSSGGGLKFGNYLEITDSSEVPSGLDGTVGQYIKLTRSGAINETSFNYGQLIEATASGEINSIVGNSISIAGNNEITGTQISVSNLRNELDTSRIEGLTAGINLKGTGTVSQGVGIAASISMSKGSATDIYGLKSDLSKTDVPLENYYGAHLTALSGGQTEAIYGAYINVDTGATDAYGVYIDSNGFADASNLYGLYIKDQSPTFGSNTHFNIYSDGLNSNNYIGGKLGIGITSPLAPLHINRGFGANAAFILNQTDNGDIFTASSSGATKFTITNSGGIRLGTDEGSSGECLLSQGVGNGAVWGSCGGISSGGSSNWVLNSTDGTLSPINNTLDFLWGGSSTASAKFRISGDGPLSGTIAAASVSANTSFAGLVVDNRGVGDIFTASSSGLTRFTIAQSGNVLIGTGSADSKLTVRGGNITHRADGDPTLVANYTDLGTNVLDVFISGRYAYVTVASAGLYILDITDPATLRIVGSYTGTGFVEVVVGGKYAYVAHGTSGVTILDISNPKAPQLAATLDTPGIAQYVYLSGKYLYVGDHTSGLQIIDVANPTAPRIVGNVNTGGSALDVYVVGKFAYVADHVGGLVIVDVSNPAAPAELSTYDTGAENANAVYVSGQYAYIAYGNNGLDIVDISNPRAPVRVGILDTSGSASSVIVSGRYVYVGDSTGGLLVIDVADVSTPQLIGSYPSTFARRMAIVGKHLYQTDASSGLYILDINGTETPVLSTGQVTTNGLIVTENANIGNNLFVRNGLNIGEGGLMSNGALTVVTASGSGNLIQGGPTGQALLVLNQTGNQDILTASVAGVTKFRVANDGTVHIGTNEVSNGGLTFYSSGASETDPTISADASGNLNLLTPTGVVRIGTETDGLTFDYLNGGPTFAGTARPTKTITLSPEYPGAILTAFNGSTTDTDIVGSLTSDADTTQGTSIRNYYQWERTVDATQHFYTVAVRVTLPKDFGGWADTNALTVSYITESATNTVSDLDVRVYNENSATVVASSADNASTSWTTVSIDDSTLDDNTSSEWDEADETAVIYLRMGSASSNYVRIGDIKLNYRAKF